MPDAADITDLGGRVRSSVLGRSESLLRLFDYLLSASAAGLRPKEFEVAQAVFGRSAAFDGAQDASVRVAAHRLRRKLEEFYAGPGRDEPYRLSLPKGEYRLTIDPAPAAAAAGRTRAELSRPLALILAAIVAVNLIVWAGLWTSQAPERRIDQVRRAAPWAQLSGAEGPTLLVLGDYYIFGETDPATGIDRLVREYSINSREELDAWLKEEPEAMSRYRDMGLTYLPVGSAFALRSLAPVLLEGRGSERVQVIMASDLTPEMLKQNNIVYVGYLSGLGVLKETVFAGSRYTVGETWDELVDGRSGRRFVREEGRDGSPGRSHRDYGYLASFPGPNGHRVVVIAGARDAALMETAESAASADELKQLARRGAPAEAFEALYEVEALGRSGLSGRLMEASPREERGEGASLTFPRG